MRTYASSRVKRKSFYRKSELQMFLLISGGHIGAPKRCLHTKLYKGAWNVSANNSETVGHKDLRLGQIVYILVFYNISFSWLLPLDGFQFIFFVAWQWKRSIVSAMLFEQEKNGALIKESIIDFQPQFIGNTRLSL